MPWTKSLCPIGGIPLPGIQYIWFDFQDVPFESLGIYKKEGRETSMEYVGVEVIASLCNGREVRGRVVEEDGSKLVIEAGGIRVVVFKQALAALFLPGPTRKPEQEYI